MRSFTSGRCGKVHQDSPLMSSSFYLQVGVPRKIYYSARCYQEYQQRRAAFATLCALGFPFPGMSEKRSARLLPSLLFRCIDNPGTIVNSHATIEHRGFTVSTIAVFPETLKRNRQRLYVALLCNSWEVTRSKSDVLEKISGGACM